MAATIDQQVNKVYQKYIKSPQIDKLSDNQYEHVQEVLTVFLFGMVTPARVFDPLKWTPKQVADFVLKTMPDSVNDEGYPQAVVPILRSLISFLGKNMKLKHVGEFHQALNAIRADFIRACQAAALDSLMADDYEDDETRITFAPTEQAVNRVITEEQSTNQWSAKQRQAFMVRWHANWVTLSDAIDALQAKEIKIGQAEQDNFEKQLQTILQQFSQSPAWSLVDSDYQADAFNVLENFCRQQFMSFGIQPAEWSMASLIMAIGNSAFLDLVDQDPNVGLAVRVILLPFVRYLQLANINPDAEIVIVTIRLCLIDIQREITDSMDFSEDLAKFPELQQLFEDLNLDSTDSQVVQAFLIGYQHGVKQTFGPNIAQALDDHVRQAEQPSQHSDKVIDVKSAQKRHNNK